MTPLIQLYISGAFVTVIWCGAFLLLACAGSEPWEHVKAKRVSAWSLILAPVWPIPIAYIAVLAARAVWRAATYKEDQ